MTVAGAFQHGGRQDVGKGGIRLADAAHHAIHIHRGAEARAVGQQDLNDLLRAAQGKGGHKRLAAALDHLLKGLYQPLFLRRPVGVQPPAISAFQHQHVGAQARRFSGVDRALGCARDVTADHQRAFSAFQRQCGRPGNVAAHQVSDLEAFRQAHRTVILYRLDGVHQVH